MSWEPYAKSAPKVESAKALKPEESDPTCQDVSPAVPSAAPKVEPAQGVGPAVTVDDPSKHAPPKAAKAPPNLLGVATLRGTTGADFEGKAAVLRGAPKKNFLRRAIPILSDERDFVAYGEAERFILVKGDCCFVFGDAETDNAPLYCIPLEEVRPVLEDPRHPDKNSVTISPTSNSNMSSSDMKTVLLKYKDSGKQAYQVTFFVRDDKGVAKRFVDVVERASTSRNASVDVRASVMQAKALGKAGAKAQPNI